MNSIEDGRPYERTPDAQAPFNWEEGETAAQAPVTKNDGPAAQDYTTGRQANGNKSTLEPHVFSRLPATGVPDAVARHWASADSKAYGELDDPKEWQEALRFMAENAHANPDYAQSLHKRIPGIAAELSKVISRELIPRGDLPRADPFAAAGPSGPEAAGPSVDLKKPEREHEREFEPPESLRKRYLIAGHKYYFRDAKNDLAFQDDDRRLSTKHDDPDVAASMVELAEAKGWRSVKIKGSTAFKREAWLAAALRGMEVSGYKPDKLDQARFDELRSKEALRHVNEIVQGPEREHRVGGERKGRGRQEPEQRQTAQPKEKEAEPLPRARKEQAMPPAEPRATAGALLAQQKIAINALTEILRARGDSEQAINMAAALAAERFQHPRIYVGKMIAHGPAPFEFNADNDASYYIKLQTTAGERVVWGVDLPRAIEDSKAENGHEVALSFQGKQNVTVMGKERDQLGTPTGRLVELEVERNTWDIGRLDTLQSKAKQQLREAASRSDQAQRMAPVVNVYDYAAPRQQQHEMAPASEPGKARRPERQPSR